MTKSGLLRAALSVTGLLSLAAPVSPQAMYPVSGTFGPSKAANPIDPGVDSEPGRCTSEVITTFEPPPSTKKAAFYFPWHQAEAEGSYWTGCVQPFKTGFEPVLGLYSSSNNSTTASHMAMMSSNGISVVGIEWTGIGDDLDLNARNQGGVLDAAGAAGLNVAVLYDLNVANNFDLDVDKETRRTVIKTHFQHFKDHYFSRPAYLRIGGKPVVYLYVSRSLEDGSLPSVQNRIETLFNEIRAQVGDMYLVADHLWFTGVDFEKLRQTRAQAVTAFHGADPTFRTEIVNAGRGADLESAPIPTLADEFAKRYYQDHRQSLLDQNTVNIMPGVFPQYDDRSATRSATCSLPVREFTQTYNLRNANDWKYMLDRVGTGERWNVKKIRVKRNCTETTLVDRTADPSLMWIYSFNEWAEGSGIEQVQSVSGPGRYPWRFGPDLLDTVRLHSFGPPSSGIAMPPDSMVPFPRGPSGPQGPRPNFSWDGVQGATRYEMQVLDSNGGIFFARDQPGTHFVPNEIPNPASSTDLQELDAGALYRFRVRADVDGWQAWSAETEFTTAADVPDDLPPGCSVVRPQFTLSGTGLTFDPDGTARTVVGQQIWFTVKPWTMDAGSGPLWDEGTGLASTTSTQLTGAQVSFHYPDVGVFPVVVNATDPGCGSGQVSDILYISVGPAPQAPPIPEDPSIFRDGDGECQESEYSELGEEAEDCLSPQPDFETPTCDATVSWTSTSASIPEYGMATSRVKLVTPRPLQCPVSVDYATVPGSGITATAGADYIPKSGTITFPLGSANNAEQSVSFGAVDDPIDEYTEAFSVELSSPDNATIQGSGSFAVTMDDNDPPPSVSVMDTQGLEGSNTLSYAVRLSHASDKTITVNFATSPGTATPRTPTTVVWDYTEKAGTLTFEPSETELFVGVNVSDNLTHEPGETVFLTLSSPNPNASLGDLQATGMILDDDPLPTISISGGATTEGTGGAPTAVTFQLTRSVAADLVSTVNWATASGTAISPGDFTAASGVVTFAPFETTKQVSVSVIPDSLVESVETFIVVLSLPGNATIQTGVATGTIINDDDPLPTISILGGATTEGTGGAPTAVTFQLTRSVAANIVSTVNWATAPGTAISPGDFTAASGVVTFAPLETTKQVSVSIVPDSLAELAETFTVTLSLPGNATIQTGVATGTINDDDPLPAVAISDVTVSESVGTAVLTVTLSSASGMTTTVNYATQDGSALIGPDFQLIPGQLEFAPGELTRSINVTITNDTGYEIDETFTVALAAASGATISDASGLVTILNNDTQASRVFLSPTGLDSNDCAIVTTPCRLFAEALFQVASHGEVIATGSGSFGALNITKPVKVSGGSRVVAFSSMEAVINVSVPGAVVLRNVTLKAPTVGAGTGVSITAGEKVELEGVSISDWLTGLQVSGPTHVSVNHSTFRNNGTAIRSTSSGARVDLMQTSIGSSSSVGVDVQAGAASILASQIFGNVLEGVKVGANTTASIHTSHVTFNGSGVKVMASGTASLSRNLVTGNTVGVSGALQSTGKNVIRGNGTDVSGSITPVPGQ